MTELNRVLQTDKLRYIVNKVSHKDIAKPLGMTEKGAERIYRVLKDKDKYLTDKPIAKLKKAIAELNIPKGE